MTQTTTGAPRIVLLSAEYPPDPGGVGDYTHNLAQQLHELGVPLLVLTGVGAAQDEPFPVWRRITSWGRGLRNQVHAALQEWQADALHIQYQTGAYAMKPAINLLPSRLSVPTLVTFHDLRMPYLAPKVAPLRRYITRLLIEGARHVIVTNAEDQARLLGTAAPSNDPDVYQLTRPLQPAPTLIPIGVNIAVSAAVERSALRQQLGYTPQQTVIVYFGMLNRTKGVHTIIQALAELPAAYQLLIIGGMAQTPPDQEYAAEINQLIAELGVAERIQNVGYVPAERASELLQAADLAALPFLDGAAYRRGSLLATLAHGLPTLTTRPHMQLDPALHHEHNIMFVPVEQPAALAESIEQLATSPELRQRLAASGPRLAAAFRWEAIGDRHLKVYSTYV